MSNIELSNVNSPSKDLNENNLEKMEKDKEEKELKEKEDKKIMLRNVKFKIIFYLLYIACFLSFIYIIKPISFLVELYFLYNAPKLTGGESVILVGWVMLFVYPLLHIYFDGMKIIAIQETLFLKLYTTIIVLIEIYFGFPLPFMYAKTIYSIFLFNERGIELMIAPWMIFFPTTFIKSVTELVRNLICSMFFFGYSIYVVKHYNPTEINTSRTMNFLIVLEAIKLVGYILFITLRTISYFNDKKRKNKLEIQKEKEQREEKEKKRGSDMNISKYN